MAITHNPRIAQAIKDLRGQESQLDFAEKLGGRSKYSSLQRYETQGNPSNSILKRLAAIAHSGGRSDLAAVFDSELKDRGEQQQLPIKLNRKSTGTHNNEKNVSPALQPGIVSASPFGTVAEVAALTRKIWKSGDYSTLSLVSSILRTADQLIDEQSGKNRPAKGNSA